jgi:hypothetical protein
VSLHEEQTAGHLYELSAALKLLDGSAAERYPGEAIDLLKKNAKTWSWAVGHAYCVLTGDLTVKVWRTLVRVHRTYPGEVRVIVPGWHPQQDVKIPDDQLPTFTVKVGDRLHAKVNIGAQFPGQLVFTDWEAS